MLASTPENMKSRKAVIREITTLNFNKNKKTDLASFFSDFFLLKLLDIYFVAVVARPKSVTATRVIMMLRAREYAPNKSGNSDLATMIVNKNPPNLPIIVAIPLKKEFFIIVFLRPPF